MKIIDTNNNTTAALGNLLSAGIGTVIRYIAAGLVGNEKVIKPAEARAIAKAGMRLGLVYEIGGKPSGSAIGKRDGDFSRSYAPTVGAPQGSVIWYAVDYDAGPLDYPGIKSAFLAFKAALGGYYLLGCYASGYIADRLTEDGAIDKIAGVPLIWLTDSMGFRGSRVSAGAGRYVLLQGLPRRTATLDTDPDALNARLADVKIDYVGDFVPVLSTGTSPTIEGSMAWVQTQLNAKTNAGLDVDGVNGPMTIRAVEKFQRDSHIEDDGIVGPDTIDAIKGLA